MEPRECVYNAVTTKPTLMPVPAKSTAKMNQPSSNFWIGYSLHRHLVIIISAIVTAGAYISCV